MKIHHSEGLDGSLRSLALIKKGIVLELSCSYTAHFYIIIKITYIVVNDNDNNNIYHY